MFSIFLTTWKSIFFDERHGGWLFLSMWERRTNATRIAKIATWSNALRALLTDVQSNCLAVTVDDDHRAQISRSAGVVTILTARSSPRLLGATVRKVRPRGGPRRSWRWSLPPRSALDDNTRRVSVDRSAERERERDECLLRSTFAPARAGRRSAANRRSGRLIIAGKQIRTLRVSGCLERSDSLPRRRFVTTIVKIRV